MLVEPDDRRVHIDDRKMKDWKFASPPVDGWRSPLIAIVDVGDAVALLRQDDARSKAVRWQGCTLDDMMDEAARIYRGELAVDACDERGWKCRDCEYNGEGGPLDGFDRCWAEDAESARNLTTLYYGKDYGDPNGGKGGRWVHLRVENSLLERPLTVADLDDDPGTGDRAHRRTIQMEAERSGTPIIGDGLKQAVEDQLRPEADEAILWFIDFETSMSCLPHFVGDHPYQVVPFQFSCHAVPVRGGVPQWSETAHDEWLFDHNNLDASSLNIDREFTDALRRAVTQPIAGITDAESSVFHWATHERTVLKAVRTRIKAAKDPGDEARIAFLDAMVGVGDQKTGGRLIDMLRVAEDNVFHPLQKGRFSIKQFLPAICADADIRSMVRSLVGEAKDDGAVPVGEAWDPYKGLPPVAELLGGDYQDIAIAAGDADDGADAFGGDALSSGTDAMRAFAALRYGADGTGQTWNEHDKQQIHEALLIYCKLDTAAMVAVWRWLDGQV